MVGGPEVRSSLRQTNKPVQNRQVFSVFVRDYRWSFVLSLLIYMLTRTWRVISTLLKSNPSPNEDLALFHTRLENFLRKCRVISKLCRLSTKIGFLDVLVTETFLVYCWFRSKFTTNKIAQNLQQMGKCQKMLLSLKSTKFNRSKGL